MIVSTLNIWIVILVTSKLYSNFDAMQPTVQRPLKMRSLKFLVV